MLFFTVLFIFRVLFSFFFLLLVGLFLGNILVFVTISFVFLPVLFRLELIAYFCLICPKILGFRFVLCLFIISINSAIGLNFLSIIGLFLFIVVSRIADWFLIFWIGIYFNFQTFYPSCFGRLLSRCSFFYRSRIFLLVIPFLYFHNLPNGLIIHLLPSLSLIPSNYI